VKQLEIFFRTFWLAIFVMLTATPADAYVEVSNKMDSIEIGLITCTPHEEIYSLYGHTALRYHDLRTDKDLVFNYGVFNPATPYFVVRFMLGKTDYELGVAPFKPFCKYYEDWGCMVSEQVLNLTNEDKECIARALSINMQPQNRVYRYNIFYENCSTRPRDIIENNIVGKVIYAPRQDSQPTFRELIHEMTARHPWASMGNDLVLGLTADRKATQREQQFLPLNLRNDFDYAKVYYNNQYRPLVKERRILVAPETQEEEDEDGFSFTPTLCALGLLLICIGVALLEWRKKRRFAWFDVVWMAVTGLAGLLLLVMFFSEHPATSTNLQILLLNPAWLFFIPSVIRRKPTRYWTVLISCIVLFLLGAFLQDYAEGMEIMALCLLTRFISHIKNDK
jgi:hypothetical protein